MTWRAASHHHHHHHHHRPATLCKSNALSVPCRVNRQSKNSTRPPGVGRRAQKTIWCLERPRSTSTSSASPSTFIDLKVGSGLEANSSLFIESKSRLRVAVDVDEVLGRFLWALNKYCLETYGMSYDISDYFIYDFATVWKVSQEHSRDVVHGFFESERFLSGIPTIPDAYDTLHRLQSFCDLIVITSRQHVIEATTLDWLDRHFPSLFQEVHFGNHYAMEGKSRSKSEMCQELQIDVLIDDNPRYATEVANANIQAFLFDWKGEYPWSKMKDGDRRDEIVVVQGWGDVERYLKEMSVASKI